MPTTPDPTDPSLYWTEDILDFDFAAEVCPDVGAFFSCIHCGSCTASCPTANAMRISPQRQWRLVRLGMRHEVLESGAFWLCTSCDACTTHCPRQIPLLDTVIGLKHHVVRTLEQPPGDVALLHQTVRKEHNISGDDNAGRLRWAENLAEPFADLEDVADADVLMFVGCVGSFYPRAFSVPVAMGRLLERAGLKFAVLGGNEWCCGYPLHNAGYVDDIGAIAEHHVGLLREAGVSTMVTACPSCFYAWTVLYPRYAQLPGYMRVLHASQLLVELLESGRLVPRPGAMVATYHDPCDLGRKGGEYEAPRALIRHLPGVELREMANIKAAALCCGGGGDVKIYSQETTMAVATRRLRQATDVGADTILSGCQQCKRALTGAVHLARRPTRVLDLTELVWERVQELPP